MRGSEGQNIFDVTMQGYGDLELLFQCIKDNDFTVNSNIGGGQDILIDENQGNIEVKEFILVNNIVLNNRTYDNEIEVEETLAIQWPVFVDPAEIVYPFKLIAP